LHGTHSTYAFQTKTRRDMRINNCSRRTYYKPDNTQSGRKRDSIKML